MTITGAVALIVLFLGFVVGFIVGHWNAARTFNRALEELDNRHHEENIVRNLNILKMCRRSDQMKHRHWDN